MRCSYSAFGQGQGSDTDRSGSPAAAACASTSERRTACLATRAAASLNVVRSPPTSIPCKRSWWSVHALSFPELHERRTRRAVMGWSRRHSGRGGAGVNQPPGDRFDAEVEPLQGSRPQEDQIPRLSEYHVVPCSLPGNPDDDDAGPPLEDGCVRLTEPPLVIALDSELFEDFRRYPRQFGARVHQHRVELPALARPGGAGFSISTSTRRVPISSPIFPPEVRPTRPPVSKEGSARRNAPRPVLPGRPT